MLWGGQHKDYLETWYTKLEEEVRRVCSAFSDEELSIENIETFLLERGELEAKISHLSQLVTVYREALNTLREENTKYRELLLNQHGHIDYI